MVDKKRWMLEGVAGYFLFGVPLSMMKEIGVPVHFVFGTYHTTLPYWFMLLVGILLTQMVFCLVDVYQNEYWDAGILLVLGFSGLGVGVFVAFMNYGLFLFANSDFMFAMGMTFGLSVCISLWAFFKVDTPETVALGFGVIVSSNACFHMFFRETVAGHVSLLQFSGSVIITGIVIYLFIPAALIFMVTLADAYSDLQLARK